MTETTETPTPTPTPEPQSETPETPETPETKQITMTQAGLDSLIKSRQAAALRRAAAAEAEVARLKAIKVGESEDATTIEKLRAEIALESQRATAAENRAAQQQKEVLQSRLGAAIDAVSSDAVAKLLSDRLTIRDGKPVVLDEAGADAFNLDGSAVTPEQLYREFGESNPWAIRSSVRGGTGSSGSTGAGAPQERFPVETIFGARSSSAKANELALKNPREYQRLKAEAQKRGLI